MAWGKLFSKTTWANKSAPALSASNLNGKEYALDKMDDRIIELDVKKCEKDDVDTIVMTHLKEITSAMETTAEQSKQAVNAANISKDCSEKAGISAQEAEARLNEVESIRDTLNDAISRNIPTVSFNPENGHLECTGGTLKFLMNEKKHLIWEVLV